MKHLKQASETLTKTSEKHLKIIANICNIQMKHLQTYVWNSWKQLKHMLPICMYMQHLDPFLQHPDKPLATFVWNRWNICDIHLKHSCITITTYVASRSTFVISIYNACNIPLKLLKHFELYICNIHRIPVRPRSPSSSGRRRAATVAGGETRGLPCQGSALLLALAAPVSIIGQGGAGARVASGAAGRVWGIGTWATGWAAEQEQRQERHMEQELEEQGERRS
jgi:hypothetical protein